MKIYDLRFTIYALALLCAALRTPHSALGQAISYVPATQAEVDAGLSKTKGVTPKTLAGYLGGVTNGVGGAIVNGVLYTNLMTAATNAVAPTTIHVLAGMYYGNQLGKNGVNWQCDAGVTISNYCNDSVSNSWLPIFSDFNGATNYYVAGNPTIAWNTGTNFQDFVGTTNVTTFHPSTIGSTNANQYAALFTTNPASSIQIDMGKGLLYSYDIGPRHVFAFFKNGTVHFNYEDLLDNTFGLVVNWIRPNGATNPVFRAYGSFVFWSQGECYVHFKHTGRSQNGYGFWSTYPTNSTIATNNLWVVGDYCEARLYTSADGVGAEAGKSNASTYRSWYKLGWLDMKESTAAAANFFAGFNYLTAQKVSRSYVDGQSTIASLATLGGPGDTTTWLDIDKVTSSSQFLNNAGGRVYGRVGMWDELAPVNVGSGGIFNSGTNVGMIDLMGNLLTTTNGFGVTHSGGTTRLNGYKISMLGGAYPAVAVLTNGLTLNNVTLVAPTSTFSMLGSNGTQAVTFWGGAITAPGTNITGLPLTTNLQVLSVLPSTFSTWYFTNGTLLNTTTP